MQTVFLAVIALAWAISPDMAYADSTCATFANLLVLQADMLKSETAATARFLAKGATPLTSPEQIAQWAADLKGTADEVKARCTQ
jgi:hypothetical protein